MLPQPARHYPFLTGRYSVAAGISKLGTAKAFEIDEQYPLVIAGKRQQMDRSPEKYFRTHEFPSELEQATVTLLLSRLAREWPGVVTSPTTTLDTFARQVQEDIVVLRRLPDGRDFNAAIHLCSPNGWAAAEKIGRSFFETHIPVAGIEPVNAKAAQFAEMMVAARDGLVRFVWGIRTDDFLDHHPESPSIAWNPSAPQAWARVERQVILGMPEQSAAIFMIRTYLYDVRSLSSQERAPLIQAIEAMPLDSARYKGLLQYRPDLLAWMRALP